MITFITGDMFETPAEIRINTVNCKGAMGAGVALAFKKRYPDMFKEYKSLCSNGEIHTGKLHIWDNHNFVDPLTIVNFPTKDDWKQPSEYSYIIDGLRELRKYLESRPDATVTLPALGCGHGGLDWKKVKKLIEDELGNLQTKICVFEPADSQAIGNKISQEEIRNLEEKGIIQISPSHKFYPDSLKGKSANVFYLKGNEEVLTSKKMAWIISRKIAAREEAALNLCLESLLDKEIVPVLGTTVSERKLAIKFLENKKKIILLSDVGILNFKIPKELQELWNPDLITVISSFSPSNEGGRYNGLEVLKGKSYWASSILVSTFDLSWLTKVSKKILQDFAQPFYINYDQDISSLSGRLEVANFQKISKSSEGKPKVEKILEVTR